MSSKNYNFFAESEHVFLMKLFNIHENPPVDNKDPVVPINDWTFEKHTLIFAAAEVRAVQTRKWRKSFFIVDACAGSGAVFHENSESWYEGSPLIYANITDRVCKTKSGIWRPDIHVFAVEKRKNTFNILNRVKKPFDIDVRFADCNEEIKKLIESEIPEKDFAHFFIDPFDMGHPPIQSETVSMCLKRSNTELVLFFPWEQVVSRLAGYVGIEKPEDTHITGMESLTSLYFGDESWKKIEQSLPSQKNRTTVDKIKRRQKYVELYKEKLETIFKGVNYVEIPINSDQPKYFLFFAANQAKQPQIFMNQVDRTRKRKMKMIQKKQPQILDSFFNLGETQSQVVIPPKKTKPPKWRNIYNYPKNYCRRLLGSQESMRNYCSLDLDCDQCLYVPPEI